MSTCKQSWSSYICTYFYRIEDRVLLINLNFEDLLSDDVEMKDAETKRNKASVAHTGWNNAQKKEGRERLQRRNDMEKEDLNY